MDVKCITIIGENAIVASAEFDWLCEQARKVEKLQKVASAAAEVCKWDWSGNDDDCVADVEQLRKALDAA